MLETQRVHFSGFAHAESNTGFTMKIRRQATAYLLRYLK